MTIAKAQGVEVLRLIRFDGEGSLKAYCDVAVGGGVVVKGVRVVQGQRGLFVTSPRTQGKDGRWYDVVLFPDAVKHAVIAAYTDGAVALELVE